MTQLEAYLEKRARYRDVDGLMSHDPTTPGQKYACLNGLLYNSEDAQVLRRLKDYDTLAAFAIAREEIRRLIEVAQACRESEGVYRRAPGHADYAHHDDLIGLATLYVMGGWKLASEFYNHGKETGWVYGPVSLRWFQQDIAHFEWAAGITPPWWRQIWWYVAVRICGMPLISDRNGTDPWILSWLQLELAEHKNWLTRRAARIWRRRLYRKYPGGLRDVLDKHFGRTPDGEVHPIAEFYQPGSEPGAESVP